MLPGRFSGSGGAGAESQIAAGKVRLVVLEPEAEGEAWQSVNPNFPSQPRIW